MLGAPDASVRSTSVFTKNPTRSSSALSVRPAIGLPSAMSLPPPSRLSSPTNPACNTMNRLAPPERASRKSPACSSPSSKSPTLPPRWLATAGRSPSLGRSICPRKPIQMRPQRWLTIERKLRPRSSCQHPRKLCFPHLHDRKRRPHRARVADLLPRYPVALRKHRAQALVPLHHIAERSLQRSHIQLPRKPHRHRNDVARAVPLQPMQEPEPMLRIRQRDLSRTRIRPQGSAPGLRMSQMLRQPRNRGRLKQRPDRDLHIQARPHPADQ